MKTLIKSAEVSASAVVRAVTYGAAAVFPSTPQADSEILTARARIVALETALAQETERSAALRAEIEPAFERGRDAGHAAGMKEADTLEAEKLKRLEAAIKQASSDLRTAMEGAERLALLIARDSLDLLLGQPDYRSEILAGLIRRQIMQSAEDSIVEVRVSTQDFADPASLAILRTSLGDDPIAIVADTRLASGACTMDLKLGQAHIGLDQQWGAVSHLLSEMAGEVRS